MASKPVNDTPWNRFLTLTACRLCCRPFLRNTMQEWGGMLFVSKFVIKASHLAQLAEANTMQFVANNTSIPVPKVYCSFEHKGVVYMVIERIPGEMAAKRWSLRSPEANAHLLRQLKGMVDELRHLQPPPGIGVANVDGGPVFDMRLPGKRLWGPYATFHDFHKDLRSGFEAEDFTDATATAPKAHLHLTDMSNPRNAELARMIELQDRPWDRPYFTHGDLSSLNIMVQGDKITGIIDWETAGWMPPYWEYSNVWWAAPYQNQFWRDVADQFVTSGPDTVEMETIRRRYFADIT